MTTREITNAQKKADFEKRCGELTEEVAKLFCGIVVIMTQALFRFPTLKRDFSLYIPDLVFVLVLVQICIPEPPLNPDSFTNLMFVPLSINISRLAFS